MLLSTGSASAGFDDDWWKDSWSRPTSASSRPIASNLVARQWVETWTQTSTGTNIPAITWTNQHVDWVYSDWLPERKPYDSAGVLYPNSHISGDWNNDFSITQLSHYPGIGATNVSSRSWTNTFIEYPRPDFDDTNAYNFAGHAIDNIGTVSSNTATYSFLWTNATVSVTTDLTMVVSPVVVTQRMSRFDALAYDSYNAIAERWAVAEGDRDEDRRDIDDIHKPVMGRRGDVRNLQRVKDFLAATLVLYVDPFTTNDFTESFGTNYADLLEWSDFALTATGLCAQLEIPTNYFDYVPPQMYSMDPLEDYGRLVTNTYIMVCDSTNTCTNTVYDFSYNERDIIGTNGQSVTITSTNEDILAGFTVSDYGYKYMPDLITNGLVWIGGAWTVDSVAYDGGWNLGISNATWNAAKGATHRTNGFSDAVGNWSYGEYDASTNQYFAEWYASQHTLRMNSATNIEANVDVYLFADTTPNADEPFEWNDDTYTNLVESRMALVESTNTTSSTVTVIVGSTNQPTWCEEPSGLGTNATGRGARMNLGEQRALFRYSGFDNE